MTATVRAQIASLLAAALLPMPFATGAARAESVIPIQYGDWMVTCYSGMMPSNHGASCMIGARIEIDTPGGGRAVTHIDIRAPRLWNAEVTTSGENPATCGQVELTERLPDGYATRDREASAAARARLNARIAAIIRSHLAMLGDCKAGKARSAAFAAAFDAKRPQLDQAIAHVEDHWSDRPR
jgi:hypothetical protein